MKGQTILFTLLILIILTTYSNQMEEGSMIMAMAETTTGGFSETHIKAILKSHNKYRNQMALKTNKIGPKLPYAGDMIQMYWSKEIARKAQSWANRNKFEHSSRSHRTLKSGMKLGENIYMKVSTAVYPQINWNEAVTAWFNEITDNQVNSNLVKQFKPTNIMSIGHLTQVIWAKSYLIGCGVSKFAEGGTYKNIYVCQYGPNGNFMGNPIFTPSNKKSCGKCPSQTSCKNKTYKGLCCPKGFCNLTSKSYQGPALTQ